MAKRFSRQGLKKIQKSFEVVDLLLTSTSTKLEGLENELSDLECQAANITRECLLHSSEKANDFYNQRMSHYNQQIEKLKQDIATAEDDNYDVIVCFKRYYYLLYGKPNLSDLK